MPSRNMEAFQKLKEQAEFEKDLTSEASQQAIWDAYTPDFVLIEPPTLPHGGVHHGREKWREVHEVMRSLWHQKVMIEHTWDVPEDDLIVLYSTMEWTAHATGKMARFPAIELLHFRDGLIAKVEMFLQDTKVILDTLEPD
jgi:ketosteroid isomerase-like protein